MAHWNFARFVKYTVAYLTVISIVLVPLRRLKSSVSDSGESSLVTRHFSSVEEETNRKFDLSKHYDDISLYFAIIGEKNASCYRQDIYVNSEQNANAIARSTTINTLFVLRSS